MKLQKKKTSFFIYTFHLNITDLILIIFFIIKLKNKYSNPNDINASEPLSPKINPLLIHRNIKLENKRHQIDYY